MLCPVLDRHERHQLPNSSSLWHQHPRIDSVLPTTPNVTESSRTTSAFFPLLCTYINHQYNLDAHCVHLQHTNIRTLLLFYSECETGGRKDKRRKDGIMNITYAVHVLNSLCNHVTVLMNHCFTYEIRRVHLFRVSWGWTQHVQHFQTQLTGPQQQAEWHLLTAHSSCSCDITDRACCTGCPQSYMF